MRNRKRFGDGYRCAVCGDSSTVLWPVSLCAGPLKALHQGARKHGIIKGTD